MDINFGSLIPSNFTCGLNGLMLGFILPRYAIRTRLTYSPFIVSRNDMLSFSGHCYSLE